MSTNYSINEILKATGLGVGEGFSPKRGRRNATIKTFSASAYCESYSFIVKDELRNNLQSAQLTREIEGIRARGEGVDEIKDKVKEGVAKVKKVLIELYDKAIRFFTETVAYWLSNERKVGKQLAVLKAKHKKLDGLTIKNTDTAKIKLKDYSITSAAGESFRRNRGRAYGEADETTTALTTSKDKDELNYAQKMSNKEEKLDAYTSELDEFAGKSDNDYTSILDKTTEIIRGMKEKFQEEVEKNKELKSSTGAEMNKSTAKTVLSKLMSDLETKLESSRKSENENASVLNKEIRKLIEEKRKLEKEFKDAKDKSEEGAKAHQRARAAITGKVKITNAFKAIKDKRIGVYLAQANMMISDSAKIGA